MELASRKGALLRSDVDSDRVSLLVDGVVYPVADAESLASLGLAGVTPLVVPDQVLSLVPHGVELSRAAARGSAAD